MTQPAIEALLTRHMNKRTLAVILGTWERELDQHLPKDVSERFRRVVLGECRRFLELVIDVVGALDDESCIVNEEFLDKLEELMSPVPVNGRG